MGRLGPGGHGEGGQMDYVRAVKFPLGAEGWVAKVVIGVVVSLVPIANLATYGYAVEVVRRVAAGDPEELPTWEAFGRFFVRGFAVAVASLLYTLPGMLAFGLLLIAGSSSGGLVALSALLMFTYFLFVGLVFPVAVVRYALTDEWYTMFDFAWLAGFIGRHLGSYLGVLAGVLVIALLFALLAIATFGLAALLTNFWVLLAAAHLLGQLARRGAALEARAAVR
jgi:hypothetical protein